MKAIHNIDNLWPDLMEAPRRIVKIQRKVLEDIAALNGGFKNEDVAVKDLVELVVTHENTKMSFKRLFRFEHIAEYQTIKNGVRCYERIS